jgi:small-conductance mechanosensitive channel
MQKIIGAFRLTHFLSVITKWYVFILFLPPAAGLIQLPALSTFLLSVALWIPNVILAVIIGIVGLMAAHYTEWKILETKAKTANIIAYLAKIVIVIFTLLIVLDQIGVKIAIAQTSFLIILSGIMLSIALMLGIGFGAAFKEEAKRIIKDVKKKI